jgi:integrase
MSCAASSSSACSDLIEHKLIGWDLLDQRASLASRPLTEHIDAWHQNMLDTGKTEAHANLYKARAAKLIDGCGFVRFADVESERVEGWLAKQRRGGMSVRTSNFYLGSVVALCRWMIRNKRTSVGVAEIPLADVDPMDAELDRKLVRRPLTIDELGRLIRAAEQGADWQGIGGKERALVYRLVAETGLRRNEIRSLTKASFNIAPEVDEPSVTVAATNSKRRKFDVLPIRSDLAASLRLHLQTKLPTAQAFKLNRFTAKMMRFDMQAAGIDHDTADGVLDFHSLRQTMITNLARGGVHPKVAQTLARHSNINLTMNTYTKLGHNESRKGLDVLPRIASA